MIFILALGLGFIALLGWMAVTAFATLGVVAGVVLSIFTVMATLIVGALVYSEL